MPVEGIREATPENMKKLHAMLTGVGVTISDDLNSKRNLKLRDMILAQERYGISDVIEAFGNLPDEQVRVSAAPQPSAQVSMPRQDAAGVIIWAGGKLSDFYIEKLRAEYLKLGQQVQRGDTGQLATILYQRVVIEPDPSGNETRKAALGDPDAIHQALDQELIHADAVARTEKILSDFGKVTVYRPQDAFFIRPDLQNFPGSWKVYNPRPSDSAPLLGTGLDMSKKTILVSIGHGYNDGSIAFPSLGLVSQMKIADMLALADTENVLRIPLQCYPYQAVSAWPGVAVSIDSKERSDDLEMQHWIKTQLAAQVKQWLTGK